MSLLDAAHALEDLAAGRVPDRAQLIAGALAVDTLYKKGQTDRDLEDALIALQLLAIGSPFESHQLGRARASVLADELRRVERAE